jgi:Holliday junction resolvase
VKNNEQGILNSILEYLAIKHVLAIHVRNSGAIIQREGKTFFGKPKASQRGVADVICVHKGTPIAIEVKTESGVVSPYQLDWADRWQEAGGQYLIARDVREVQKFIEMAP